MSTFAIIMSEAEFNRRVEEAVEKKLSKLRDSIEVEKALPIELTCRAAAEVLGISETTFHARCRTEKAYEGLKKYKGNRVFVRAADLKNL